MTVDDVFASDISYRHEREETVSGVLVVSRLLTFLCPSEEARDRCILVNAPGLRDLWVTRIPPMAGTMVAYTGIATITGQICKTGLAPVPYAFVAVRSLDFETSYGMRAEYPAKD